MGNTEPESFEENLKRFHVCRKIHAPPEAPHRLRKNKWKCTKQTFPLDEAIRKCRELDTQMTITDFQVFRSSFWTGNSFLFGLSHLISVKTPTFLPPGSPKPEIEWVRELK